MSTFRPVFAYTPKGRDSIFTMLPRVENLTGVAGAGHYHGLNWRGQHYNEATGEWHVDLYTDFK